MHLPRIDVLLASMVGLVFFSKVDRRKRYHQVMVFEDHIYKTTFKAHIGTYECPGLPFGQTNSGKTFQRVVDFLFIKHLNVNIFAYQDDILIATPTLELHYEVLEHVFSQLDKYNLKANLGKCQFFMDQINFLGFIITREEILPDANRMSPILNFPQPTSVSQILSFLGMLTFYRGHLVQFSKVAKLLYQLLKKDVPFSWGSA